MVDMRKESGSTNQSPPNPPWPSDNGKTGLLGKLESLRERLGLPKKVMIGGAVVLGLWVVSAGYFACRAESPRAPVAAVAREVAVRQPDSVPAPIPAVRVMATAVISVKPLKSNGKAWDALGGMPDIALCVTAGGRTLCSPGGGKTAPSGVPSLCQDSLECTVEIEVPAESSTYTIQVVDIDLSTNDAIGSGTCKNGQQCTLGLATVQITTQKQAENNSPAPADSVPAPTPAGRVMATAVVSVEPLKSNGKAWDALDGMPDIALCVTAGGRTLCSPGGGETAPSGVPSLCQDSLECTVEIEVPAESGTYTIQVVDIDLSTNDAIGSGTCKNGQQCTLGLATVQITTSK